MKFFLPFSVSLHFLFTDAAEYKENGNWSLMSFNDNNKKSEGENHKKINTNCPIDSIGFPLRHFNYICRDNIVHHFKIPPSSKYLH